METEIDNAPKLLLEAAKIIDFVFIEPYCKRHMNRSEGAKNVGPPQKNSLDLLLDTSISSKYHKKFLDLIIPITPTFTFTFYAL